MPSSPVATTAETATPQSFRQTQALAIGFVTMVSCALLVVLGLFSSAGLSVGDVTWPLSLALLAWALFVRPRVVIRKDAVLLQNLVRDVQIPWDRIDATQARWNLRVVTGGGATYGSWAISKQRPPRSGLRSMSGVGGGEMGLRTAFRNARDHEIDTEAFRNPPDRPKSAGAIAVLIDQEQDRRVGSGRATSGTADVRVTAAWPGIAAVGMALALLVIAVLA